MDTDTNSVVFVGPVDLADITGKTRARFSQLSDQIGMPGALLTEGDALLNGRAIWRLDSIIPRLEAAGYTILQPKVAALRKARSVPSGTIPVGVAEAAEILAIDEKQFQGRATHGNAPLPCFRVGSKRAWDIAELVADAGTRGYPVDTAAEARWRQRNGGDHAPTVNRVVTMLRLDSAVTSASTDAAKRNAQMLLENPEILNAALASLGLRVLTASVESMEASPLP
ncbi:MAG: hypothetical protein HOV87_31300 [Catenulispora sp.]|nr:hypothetical protein [Catenulispora sp.]